MSAETWLWALCTGSKSVSRALIVNTLKRADQEQQSFKSGRYFGMEGDELCRTRVMHLPPHEPDQTVEA